MPTSTKAKETRNEKLRKMDLCSWKKSEQGLLFLKAQAEEEEKCKNHQGLNSIYFFHCYIRWAQKSTWHTTGMQ
jgi:hypothetical protein